MSSKDRPLAITGVSWLYIVVGAVAFVYHSPELWPPHGDAILVECVELIGVTAGVFMLRGHDWARWLALAWAVFHVAITAFPPFHGLAAHVLVAAGIAWILLRSDAQQYFRGRAGAS